MPILRRHSAPVAIFLAVALGLVAPVLRDPTRLALGHPMNDVWNHAWGYWWVWEELRRGELPIHTDLLNWPEGGSLWFIDNFGVLMTLPVQWIAGPVAAYNAGIWANLALCGVGAYVLAWRVTSSQAGATFAGLAYMTAPHFLGQAYNGISETLAGGWLPLAIAAMREMFREPGWRWGALAGAAWAVTAIANWYYGLFAGMILGFLTLRQLFRRRPIRSLAACILVTLAIVAVPFGLFAHTMSAADAVVTRDPHFVWNTLILHNMTDLVTLFHPGKYYSPDLKAVFDEDLLVVVYVGYALLLPAAAALFARRRTAAWSWAALAVWFLLLTLGPYLYAGGDYVQVLGGWIPLPFLPLFLWFPMFSRISHAYRFVVGVTLALSVMAAFAIRAAERRALTWAVVLGTARVLESFFLSPAHFPLPVSKVEIPAIFAQLTGGAVLELPVGIPTLSRAIYVMNQVGHGSPVPYGLNDPTPAAVFHNRYGRYLLELERSTVAFLPARMPWLDIELGRQELVATGLRWIVVNGDLYPPRQFAKVAQFLDLTATPWHVEGQLRVYRLDEV